MRKVLISAILFISATTAFADDPGVPDTVIVCTVYADLGQPYVDVPIFVVTDDSVLFYNMPISWSLASQGLVPTEVMYYYPLTYWNDIYDSVLVNEHFIRMVGWHDGLFFLNTGGYRLRCWEIRFTIDSLAPPQIVSIDTTYDSINGSLLFGLIGGVESFTPVFVPGTIYYGITSDVGDNNRTVPERFALLRSYPNPFNSTATIEFSLSRPGDIELVICDITGAKVEIIKRSNLSVGKHSIEWDATIRPSGIYFAKLEAGKYSKTIKLVYLK